MSTLTSDLERGDPGGLFVEAARRFLEGRRAQLRAGGEGVRVLTALLLAHAREDDGAGDDAFVEGCGAALGLILARAHLGRTRSRGDRHPVLVGEHGTVDPFKVVREALGADDPREALASGLEEAEREARGTGPYAAAVRAFLEAVAEAGGEAKVADRFGAELTLDDGTEIDLERLLQAGEARGAIARRLALMLGSRSDGERYEELRERVLPRVVGDAFLERLGDSASALARVEAAPGLHLALIAHYGDRARFLRARELEAAGESLRSACAQALVRLAHRSASLSFRREGETIHLASRDGLDASRILLPGVARALEDALGGPPFVAAPHRDLLLSSTQPERLEALARDAYSRAPHGVSPRVYRLLDGRVIGLD